jgi:hypothetical protein
MSLGPHDSNLPLTVPVGCSVPVLSLASTGVGTVVIGSILSPAGYVVEVGWQCAYTGMRSKREGMYSKGGRKTSYFSAPFVHPLWPRTGFLSSV